MRAWTFSKVATSRIPFSSVETDLTSLGKLILQNTAQDLLVSVINPFALDVPSCLKSRYIVPCLSRVKGFTNRESEIGVCCLLSFVVC